MGGSSPFFVRCRFELVFGVAVSVAEQERPAEDMDAWWAETASSEFARFLFLATIEMYMLFQWLSLSETVQRRGQGSLAQAAAVAER